MADIYRFPIRPQLAVSCLVCNEPVPIDEDEEKGLEHGNVPTKICGKCRAAVLCLRSEIFNEDDSSDDLYIDNDDMSEFYDNLQ